MVSEKNKIGLLQEPLVWTDPFSKVARTSGLDLSYHLYFSTGEKNSHFAHFDFF